MLLPGCIISFICMRFIFYPARGPCQNSRSCSFIQFATFSQAEAMQPLSISQALFQDATFGSPRVPPTMTTTAAV